MAVLNGVRAPRAMTETWHLYESVIGNSRVWLKLQASCSSTVPGAVFEHRFTGADYTPLDGDRPVTPFRLSERCHHIANWSSTVDQLPPGWNDEEYHILQTAYPWCETLADHCECHGTKGRLDVVFCSDFGYVDDVEKRAHRTRNVRYEEYIREMEARVAEHDERQREARRRRTQRPPLREAPGAMLGRKPRGPADATGGRSQAHDRVNRLAAHGLYCSIDGRHHAYGGARGTEYRGAGRGNHGTGVELARAGPPVGDVTIGRHCGTLASGGPVTGVRGEVGTGRRGDSRNSVQVRP